MEEPKKIEAVIRSVLLGEEHDDWQNRVDLDDGFASQIYKHFLANELLNNLHGLKLTGYDDDVNPHVFEVAQKMADEHLQKAKDRFKELHPNHTDEDWDNTYKNHYDSLGEAMRDNYS